MKMIYKKNKIMICVTLIIALMLTMFMGGFANKPEVEKTLIFAEMKDAETLDHIRTSYYSPAILNMFDRLVSRDYNYSYKPYLAESWDTSEDGLVWTFHLKKGVKFHSGKPLVADDVKWTFDFILDPKTGSPYAGDMKVVKEITVLDDYTVQFELNYPFPNLLFNLSNTASSIANKEAYEKYGDEYGIKYVDGTGPYMFKEWIRGDKLVVVKNPEFNWGPDWMENNGTPLIDKVIWRVLPDANSRLMELETGGVQIISEDLPPSSIERLIENPDITVKTGEATKLGYLAYACDKEPFTDVRVRRAINHAIKKDAIIQSIFRSRAQPAYGYLPPSLKDEYYADSEKDSYEYNIGKAKELLAEAGYEDGLKLVLSSDNSSINSKLAEVLQSQLKKVGIDVEINLYDSSSYTAMLREGKQELFIRLYSWPNADILDWFWHSERFPYPNHSRWVDARTDQLIDTARTEPTWEERATAYQEVQKYLVEQAVICPIYIPEKVIAIGKEVKGFKYHPWRVIVNGGLDIDLTE